MLSNVNGKGTEEMTLYSISGYVNESKAWRRRRRMRRRRRRRTWPEEEDEAEDRIREEEEDGTRARRWGGGWTGMMQRGRGRGMWHLDSDGDDLNKGIYKTTCYLQTAPASAKIADYVISRRGSKGKKQFSEQAYGPVGEGRGKEEQRETRYNAMRKQGKKKQNATDQCIELYTEE